jgi:hypothetical protein
MRICAGSLPYCQKNSALVKDKKGTEPIYLLREFLQHKVLKLSPDEGSVCLNYDAMRAAVLNDGPLLTVRVELV